MNLEKAANKMRIIAVFLIATDCFVDMRAKIIFISIVLHQDLIGFNGFLFIH